MAAMACPDEDVVAAPPAKRPALGESEESLTAAAQPAQLMMYATTNRGIEQEAVKDITNVMCAGDASMIHSVLPGHIFFRSDSPENFSRLRGVENVFICPYHHLDSLPSGIVGEEKEAAIARVADLACNAPGWPAALEAWFRCRGLAKRGPELRFRVSCTRSSKTTKFMPSPEIAAVVGDVLNTREHWTVNLSDFDLAVQVRLSSILLYVGLPLCDQRLTQRDYIVTEGLRANVAWGLASMVGIQPGDLVVDPMCGRGALLVEAASAWPEASYIGSDMSKGQMFKSASNVKGAGLAARVSLLRADATQLPLCTGSVDKLLCDLPFGQNHGSYEGNLKLYPAALTEFARVTRVGGTALILTNLKMSRVLRRMLPKYPQWEELASEQVPLGTTISVYFKFRRVEPAGAAEGASGESSRGAAQETPALAGADTTTPGA